MSDELRTPVLTMIHGFSSERLVPAYAPYNDRAYDVPISNADRDPRFPYVPRSIMPFRLQSSRYARSTACTCSFSVVSILTKARSVCGVEASDAGSVQVDAQQWQRSETEVAGDGPKGLITPVLMDSKAKDKELFLELQRQRGMLVLTPSRKGADKSPARQRMVKGLKQSQHKRVSKQRSYTVEPRQGLIKDLCELARCWMWGRENTRGLCAAMGGVVQMHQYRA